jgi:two-component system heavy metal sensor histidine kinase CusS
MIHPLRFKHWSITHRLSLYFALSSLVLLSSMGIYLSTTLDRRLEEEHAMFLAEDIDAIRDKLASVKRGTAFADDPHWRQSITPVGSRLHLAIFSEQHEVLVPAPPPTMPLSALPSPAPIGERANHTILWMSPDGRYYRVASAWANLGRAHAQKVLIVLTLDISLERRLLAGYQDTLFITLLIAMLCSAIIGYAVARQGLSPIRRIAKAANEITSTQLDKKLELEGSPAELRELVLAFNGMLDRLNESFSRLSQFSSDLAHELRTPINNLMGEAQVALSRARTADEYRGVLESSVEELERLSRMTENMLFLAHADHSDAIISTAWLDARDELEKLAEFYQLAADESGARINCAGSVKVYADPILFRRAISNLLSNALRYSAKGGEISMEAKSEADGSVTIAVRNSGPGISPEHLTRIFDRFYRIESAREKSRDGSGLGLAIVRTIMRLHGGAVSAASTPNEFTVFILRFPPAPGAADA